MRRKVSLLCAIVSLATNTYAQRWEPAYQKTSEIRKEVEVRYAYKVDLVSLRNSLKDAVETGYGAKPVIIFLPTVEGKIEKFGVYSNPVMEKSMAERYELGSYVGIGIEDPSKYVRLSTSPNEFQSTIIKDGVFQFIEPISNDKKTYGVFYKTKRKESEHGFECTVEEKNTEDIKALIRNGRNNLSSLGITSRPSSTKYRTYRLALSTTGEYTKRFDPAGGTANTVAQMNATMTRVNGIFERDFGIHLNIQDLPAIIYTDPDTDPYTGNLSANLQQTLTSVVGNDNYDIGHVFNVVGGSGNGDAGCIGCICIAPTSSVPRGKGSAFTQDSNPTGDAFDIDYVAHEMGHQLGANHTFSNISESFGVNVEPGGGSTIMGYAGITDDNVSLNSDAYFHYSSINQVLTNLDSKTNCGVSTDIISNTPPVIAALSNYTIPKGTAYFLDAVATDAQNDALNYTWEQYDSVNNFASISGDSGWGYNDQGALARSFLGKESGRRYFPSFEHVMAGKLTNKPTWETVSYVPRTLHYAVTVRDQNPQRPMLSSSENTVTVGNDGPFKFKGLTTSSILYNNAQNTIFWDVANTNAAPYNVSHVKIDYTVDNGTTWTDLVASTPNTGSYAVQMPSSLTGSIKLRVSAINSIFYAVSPAVNIGSAPTSTINAPVGVSVLDTEVLKNSARISWSGVPGATYLINYRKVGKTEWLSSSSTTNNYLLVDLEDETNYETRVATVVNGVSGTYSSNYTFKTKGLRTGFDYCNLNSGNSYLGAIGRVEVANVNYNDMTYRAYKDVSENTSNVINLVKGTSYPISIYSIFKYPYSVKYTVWIDYNRNGKFEASERVYMSGTISPNGNGVGKGSGNFTVPATAYSGDKTVRMRVASNNSTNISDACGQLPSGKGGVIDFTVKISADGITDKIKKEQSEILIYPNPASDFIGVQNTKGESDYKIYTADGRLVLQGELQDELINVSSLIKGVYVITIKNGDRTFNSKFIKK